MNKWCKSGNWVIYNHSGAVNLTGECHLLCFYVVHPSQTALVSLSNIEPVHDLSGSWAILQPLRFYFLTGSSSGSVENIVLFPLFSSTQIEPCMKHVVLEWKTSSQVSNLFQWPSGLRRSTASWDCPSGKRSAWSSRSSHTRNCLATSTCISTRVWPCRTNARFSASKPCYSMFSAKLAGNQLIISRVFIVS